MTRYEADFETSTEAWNESLARVWAVSIIEIGNEDNYVCFNSMDKFLLWCTEHSGDIVYFHNLKYDGSYIIDALFRDGYKHITDKKDKELYTFTTLISDKNVYYSITIYNKQKGKRISGIKIYDSLKLIALSVEEIAKTYQLENSKLELDYDTVREVGHELTEQEKPYIHNDVWIVAKALESMFKDGYTKMTIGSNAMSDYKDIMGGEKKFRRYFPVPKNDIFIRQSYKGGFTYLNPIYSGVVVGHGWVYDVNSLYPSRMRYEKLPYGEPIYYKGQYKNDDKYNLYVQTIECQFELKPNKLPCIQLRHNSSFIPTEYLTNSGVEEQMLTLTSVDLELFFEQYDVYNLTYVEGYKYKSSLHFFDKYIDKWIDLKNKASISGNKGARFQAKLFLNNLYGKFSTNPISYSNIPYFCKSKDRVEFKKSKPETREPIYIAMGSFITAYSRYYTITTSQKIRDLSLEKYGKDMYIYSDTDSIHTTLPPQDCETIMEVDSVKLGAWKRESEFEQAKFLRAKTYMEKGREKESEPYEWNITCAGMPKQCYEHVNLDNFVEGSIFAGKLSTHRMAGGSVLKKGNFTIKKSKVSKS